ncbi:MAG TPA: TadE/TadG family type IV pilus assembly protein [Nevskiaceae bacterium]|nr:TadE/TadG family type IV pilus assembly protein [Nevskiaceae bacterium]
MVEQPKVAVAASAVRRRGMVTVEAAIVLPLFMLLMFCIIDFGRLLFTQTTLQHAMREGGRYGVTGRRLPNPADPKSLESRLDSIKQIVQQSAIGVNVKPGDIVISSARGGNGNAGGPGDTLTISLTYDFVFATPLVAQFFNHGSYTFTTSTSFRNEPFPPETP